MDLQWNWLRDGAPQIAPLQRAAVVEEKNAAQDFKDTWAVIQKTMWEALLPYPEARMALMEALEKLSLED